MTTFRSRQLRALRIALASGVVAALALPVGITLAWNQLLDSRASTDVAVGGLTIPETPTALIAATGAGGQLSHLFVAALDARGVGGTVVLLPVGAGTEVSEGEATRRLADVFAQDGFGALVNEVQGLLDVSFTAVGSLGRSEMINLFAPLGGVDVLLERPVDTTAVDGTVTRLAEAGESSYPIDRVVDIVLATKESEKETLRFARHREVWNGVVKRVGGGIELAPEVDTTPAGLVDATNFMRRVFGGSLQVWQLSAAPVLDTTTNPRRADLYALDQAEVVMVFASVAPSALVGIDSPLTVLVDSPFNDPVVSRLAIERLLAAGIAVGVVREVSAQATGETVLLGDPETRSTIEQVLNGSLGAIQGGAWPDRVVGIDATVVIGSEFAALARDGR